MKWFHIKPKIREYIHKKYKGICQICKKQGELRVVYLRGIGWFNFIQSKEITYRGKQWKTWHCDHIFPISLGGENQIDNYQLTCPFCNRSKNNKYESNYNTEPK